MANPYFHMLGIRFQPTLPLRGATSFRRWLERREQFEPTLPLRGATDYADVPRMRVVFQPTLPLRGATPARPCRGRSRRVSTHAPLAGSDCYILLM